MTVSHADSLSLDFAVEDHLLTLIPVVAADFGSDADTLAAASGIANKDVIFPGDIITVPCPAS